MGGTALALILVSALIHAAWNLFSKGSGIDVARFWIAILAGAVLLVPVLVLFPERVLLLPAMAWWLMALSSVWMGLYYVSLSEAYRTGQFSISYPVARSLPLVLVTVWTCVTAAVQQRTPFLPFAVVIVGCLMLPMRGFLARLPMATIDRAPAAAPARISRAALAWTGLAGLSTAVYSLSDDHCVRQLTAAPGGGIIDILVYSALQAWATTVVLFLVLLVKSGGRAQLAVAWKHHRVGAMAVGCGITVSYLLALIAMPLSPHVGWTLAFRQASIPLGAIAGLVFFNEGAAPPKLVGLGLIVGGLGWAAF